MISCRVRTADHLHALWKTGPRCGPNKTKPRRQVWRSSIPIGIIAVLSLFLTGCASPSTVNIELRKQQQQLQSQISQMQQQHLADEATIRGLQSQATTVPVLPEYEIDQLFTTAGLSFGRLTGGYHPDPNVPGDTMLKIYVVPTDQFGDQLKAAGSFEVKLFDLALKTDNLLGTWNFDLATAKAHWFSGALLYTYVLDCPWQTVPTHTKLSARITYRDALTHRLFVVDRDVTVELP